MVSVFWAPTATECNCYLRSPSSRSGEVLGPELHQTAYSGVLLELLYALDPILAPRKVAVPVEGEVVGRVDLRGPTQIGMNETERCRVVAAVQSGVWRVGGGLVTADGR